MQTNRVNGGVDKIVNKWDTQTESTGEQTNIVNKGDTQTGSTGEQTNIVKRGDIQTESTGVQTNKANMVADKYSQTQKACR